jgi:hypothetical protein
MASISNAPLADLAAGIAAANCEGIPVAPPAVAAVNPFLEVLVAEVKATLPPEFATRVQHTQDVSALMEWVAAAAMYRWIRRDHADAAPFLESLSGGPRRACEGFACALAVRAAPPERSPRWRALDRFGLQLQLGVAAGALLARAGVVLLLARAAGVHLALPLVANWLAATIDVPLISLGMASEPAQVRALAALAIWHACEVLFVPRLMERARQSSCRRHRQVLPLAWRASTFYAAWGLQSAALMGYAILAGVGFMNRWPEPPHVGVALVWILSLGFVPAVVSEGIGLLRLGSKPVVRRRD